MDAASILGYFGLIDESQARDDTNRVDETTQNRQAAGGGAGTLLGPDPFGFGEVGDAFGAGLDEIRATRDGVLGAVEKYFEAAGDIAPWVAGAVIAVTAGIIIVVIAGVILAFRVL